MRIVHIDRQRSWTGQISRAYHVGVGLRELGHEVGFIAHPGSRLAARAREDGFAVFEAPLRGIRTYRSVFKIGRWLEERQVDIVHCHGPRDHLASFLAAPLAGNPLLVRTKHNHTRLRSGYFSRLLFDRAAAVVAVSDFVRDLLLEDKIAPDKVLTIHDAVDVERFATRAKDAALLEELGIAPDELVVGNVSSLHRRKGIDLILAAFAQLRAQLPGRKLRCVLTGKNYQQWEPLVEELGLTEHVVFPGFQTDVPRYLSILDVYVLPSRQEALGTSIIEAMALGLPVVVSRTGGVAEAVTEDVGIALEDPAPEALAEAIRDLLEDPERRRRLGEAGHRRATELFPIDAMVRRTHELYQRLAGGVGRA